MKCLRLFAPLVFFLFLVSALVPSAAAQQAPDKSTQDKSTQDKPASIEGVVTNATTGAPISGAHVMVRMFLENNSKQPVYGTSTNAEGKYTISGLPAASFYATVELPGYIMPAEHNRTGANDKVAAGDKKEIKLKLQPAGQIVGRVVDQDGNPSLAEVSVDNGSAQTFRTGTDEKGQFRLGGLNPGQYRVKAKPAPNPYGMGMPPEIRADGSIETFDLTTWFPGVADRKSAARVTVGSGVDASGVEIRLLRSRVNLVTGKVVGIPPGMQRPVVMIREENGGMRQFSSVKPDGTFAISRIDPGKIRLAASGSAGTYIESAPLDVEVGEKDLENLELRFIDKADISGHVIYEDDQAKPASAAQSTATKNAPAVTGRVILQPTFGYGNFTAPIQDDGSFTLKSVPPNRYRVSLSWKSGYVRSVRLGNVESDKPEVDLIGGAAGAVVTLLIGSGVAEISGTVTDSKGPAAGVRVVLVPIERTVLARNTFVVSQPDGTYRFSGIVPANYTLFAADDDDLIYFSGNGDSYEDIRLEVEVRDKDKLIKDLQRHAK